MNFLDEPSPFNYDDTLATFEDDLSNNTNDSLITSNTIPITMLFTTNMPIPVIPKKFHLLDKHNCDSWKQVIPNSIHTLPTITVSDNDTNIKTVFLHKPNCLSFLFDLPTQPSNVTVHIYYYLSIQSTQELEDCMTLQQSIGESDAVCESILSHGFRSQQQTSASERIRRRLLGGPNPNMRQPTITSFYNTANSIELIRNLLQNGFVDTLSGETNTFEEELETLADMGFTNEELNIRVLTRTMGNIEASVNILLQSS